MSGRGDNNKQGSSGRGSSNQSNQGFVQSGENNAPSDRDKEQELAQPSIPQPKSIDPDANRNAGDARIHANQRTDERTFNLVLDGVPYVVRTTPFMFNEEMRYTVQVNNDEEDVFVWDSEIGRLRAIDDEGSTLPDALEEAISERIQSHRGQ